MGEAKIDYVTEVHRRSRALMAAWYERLQEAARCQRPAAYVMISGSPVEILRAFDLPVVFPEVDALQIGIRKESLPPILRAEAEGFASDNCAYVKAHIGSWYLGAIGPEGTLPPPALIVCNYVGCNVYIKWFEQLAHLTRAPLVMIDVPFARTEKPRPEDIDYVVGQLRHLIELCAETAGKPFEPDRLREVLARSAQAEAGWRRAKELCRNRPAPFDAYFDAINLMGPINVLRGTAEAADFFDFAVDFYARRVRERQGPLPEERFRIVFEGPPPYPYYREFRDLFSNWGAVGVASTYSCVGGLWEFGYTHDPERPLESIALHMLWENLTNRSLRDRARQIIGYADRYGADALVIHSVKSCRLFSAGQGDLREECLRDHELPTLMLESDLEDPRYFSGAQLRNRIDAFFEALADRRLRASTGGRSAGRPEATPSPEPSPPPATEGAR